MKLLQGVVFGVCVGMGALMALPAVAADDKDPVRIDVKESVQEQLNRVERVLASERYSEMSLEDKSTIRAALNRIRSSFGERETFDQLSPTVRADVITDQDQVNTLLGRAHADSRRVCTRERVVGSNMPKQVCMTVAQRERLRQQSQDELARRQRMLDPIR